jgi:hypothetical protein
MARKKKQSAPPAVIPKDGEGGEVQAVDPAKLPRYQPNWSGFEDAPDRMNAVYQHMLGKGGLLKEDVSFEKLEQYVNFCDNLAGGSQRVALVAKWRQGEAYHAMRTWFDRRGEQRRKEGKRLKDEQSWTGWMATTGRSPQTVSRRISLYEDYTLEELGNKHLEELLGRRMPEMEVDPVNQGEVLLAEHKGLELFLDKDTRKGKPAMCAKGTAFEVIDATDPENPTVRALNGPYEGKEAVTTNVKLAGLSRISRDQVVALPVPDKKKGKKKPATRENRTSDGIKRPHTPRPKEAPATLRFPRPDNPQPAPQPASQPAPQPASQPAPQETGESQPLDPQPAGAFPAKGQQGFCRVLEDWADGDVKLSKGDYIVVDRAGGRWFLADRDEPVPCFLKWHDQKSMHEAHAISKRKLVPVDAAEVVRYYRDRDLKPDWLEEHIRWFIGYIREAAKALLILPRKRDFTEFEWAIVEGYVEAVPSQANPKGGD